MGSFRTNSSRFLFLSAVAVALALPLFAQVNFGRISGSVQDSSGAVVPNVKILVLNEGTGVERSVASNESGDFIATNLAVGMYTLKLETPGFQAVTRTGLNLVADGRLTVDFKLQPAGATQSVDVVAAA